MVACCLGLEVPEAVVARAAEVLLVFVRRRKDGPVRQEVVVAFGNGSAGAEDAVTLALVADEKVVVLGVVGQPISQLRLYAQREPANKSSTV